MTYYATLTHKLLPQYILLSKFSNNVEISAGIMLMVTIVTKLQQKRFNCNEIYFD
jgi:hypothetical protein